MTPARKKKLRVRYLIFISEKYFKKENELHLQEFVHAILSNPSILFNTAQEKEFSGFLVLNMKYVFSNWEE